MKKKTIPAGTRNQYGYIMGNSERINAERCPTPLDRCLSVHDHQGMTKKELDAFIGPETPDEHPVLTEEQMLIAISGSRSLDYAAVGPGATSHDEPVPVADAWKIPDGLSPKGRAVAEVIAQFLAEHDATDDGGGGFRSPQEWAERGERWGTGSLLILLHDGGEHAGAFDEEQDYESGLGGPMYRLLSSMGVYAELCDTWYSAIYPKRARKRR
ncbi:hypothetical protein LK459_07450 [Gordonia otitidis]|uniref:hypothetical protein n=1 Tax=Gordonia otitidis TaxID=249058 RepID=UPI001D153E1F|nr:hypothetical protein [Gordonia otitidis]UEA60658.1 hypothetical protein LK459_07450 [Gordonia otitidis]